MKSDAAQCIKNTEVSNRGCVARFSAGVVTRCTKVRHGALTESRDSLGLRSPVLSLRRDGSNEGMGMK